MNQIHRVKKHNIRVNRIIIFFTVLTFLSMTLVWAESALEHTLNGYITYALNHNPSIAAAGSKVDVFTQDYRLAATLPDPKISGGYFISEIETRVGPQEGKIGASQMIPWPGKLVQKRKAAKANLNAVQKDKVDKEAKIISDIRSEFASLFATGQSISITKENLRLLQYFESVLLAKYASAVARQASVLKIQVEIALLEDHIKSLEAEGEKEKENLRALLDLDKNIAIPYPDQLPKLIVGENQKLTEDLAIKSNAALQSAEYRIQAANEKVRLARNQYAPDFMFMTDYMFTDESTMIPPPSDNGKDAWVVGGSLTLPLWVGSKAKMVKKAQAIESMTHFQRDNMENVIIARFTALREDLRDAERKIELFSKVLLPKASQTLSIIEEGYKNTQATVLDFLDAQRRLLDIELSLIKQKARREKIMGKIDRLFGGALTRKVI